MKILEAVQSRGLNVYQHPNLQVSELVAEMETTCTPATGGDLQSDGRHPAGPCPSRPFRPVNMGTTCRTPWCPQSSVLRPRSGPCGSFDRRGSCGSCDVLRCWMAGHPESPEAGKKKDTATFFNRSQLRVTSSARTLSAVFRHFPSSTSIDQDTFLEVAEDLHRNSRRHARLLQGTRRANA